MCEHSSDGGGLRMTAVPASKPPTRRPACCAVLCTVQSSKSAPNIVSDWSNTKASTEQTMKLMQMYKDLGDFEGQVRGGDWVAAAAAAGWYPTCETPSSLCGHAAAAAASPTVVEVCRSPIPGVLCTACHCLQPYLKFHNPRTFEDMDKPIPNFKKFGLKAGAGTQPSNVGGHAAVAPASQ